MSILGSSRVLNLSQYFASRQAQLREKAASIMYFSKGFSKPTTKTHSGNENDITFVYNSDFSNSLGPCCSRIQEEIPSRCPRALWEEDRLIKMFLKYRTILIRLSSYEIPPVTKADTPLRGIPGKNQTISLTSLSGRRACNIKEFRININNSNGVPVYHLICVNPNDIDILMAISVRDDVE